MKLLASAALALTFFLPSQSDYIAVWELCGPHTPPEAGLPLPPVPANWTRVRAASGVLNLARLFPSHRAQAVMFARTTIVSDTAQHVPASVAYRDDITVYVNQVPVFAGSNGSRVEKPWLPLKAGENEVLLAIAGDYRSGWGFSMKLVDAVGVRLAR